MSSSLIAVNVALSAALWLFLGCASILLYRVFRLRSVPWLMAYIPLGYGALETSRFYFHRIAQSVPDAPHVASPVAIAVYISSMLEDTAALLVALLVVGEVAALARRAYPAAESRAVDALCRLHSHVLAMGAAITVLTLASALPAIIYFYSHVHPNT
jgi:hypothetical protein